MKSTDGLERKVRTSLARAIASRDLPDDVVATVADKLMTLSGPAQIRRFDVCVYGICIDYLVEPHDWRDVVHKVFDLDVPIRKFYGFPWGIPADDLMQLSFEVEIDELAGLIDMRLPEPGGLH